MDHTLYSPSSAHRNLYCYASLIADQSYPEESSEEADEGTNAHELSSIVLKDYVSSGKKLNQILSEYGNFIKNKEIFLLNEGKKIIIEQSMLIGITPYLHVVESIFNTSCIVLIEQSVELDSVYGISEGIIFKKIPDLDLSFLKGQKGTSDLIIYDTSSRILHVLDLKYGMGVEVNVEGNEQILLYAAGALESLARYINYWEINQIKLYISQPRINKDPSIWSLTVVGFMGQLRRIRERFYYSAEFYKNNQTMTFQYLCRTVNSDSSIFNPGEHICRWCKGKGDCAAMTRFIESMLNDCFDDLTEDGVSTEGVIKTLRKTGMNDREMKRLLSTKFDAIPLISQWCNSVHKLLFDHLRNGDKGYGKKLVAGRRGKRFWLKDSHEKIVKLLRSMKFKAAEIYKKEIISPAACEIMVGKVRWGVLSQYADYSQNKPIIVDEDDPREELKNIMDEFEDISGEK